MVKVILWVTAQRYFSSIYLNDSILYKQMFKKSITVVLVGLLSLFLSKFLLFDLNHRVGHRG